MKLIAAGFTLILVGFMLIFLGVLMQSSLNVATTPNTQFAGLILLGPIPIAFGNVPASTLSNLIIVGIIFTIVMLIIYLIMFIIGRRTTRFPLINGGLLSFL